MQSPADVWRPALDPEQSDRVRAVVMEIAGRLRSRQARRSLDEKLRVESAANLDERTATLSRGLAGISLFFAYLHAEAPGSGHDETCAELLNDALGLVDEAPRSLPLYDGMPGVAWAATHIIDRFADEDAEDPVDIVDDVIAEYLELPPRPGDYDLISGLVGLGVYCVERLPRTRAAANLERIVKHLDDTAEKGDRGVTWLTPPEIVPADYLDAAPSGYYNVGVAHGVPGVIALLGKVFAAGIARSRTEPLLAGAVDWLLARMLPESGLRFPKFYPVGGRQPMSSRLAWCYGDPGIAAVLLNAARCADEPAWEREAIQLALASAVIPAEHSGVADACLCHGAAGLAHLYNRMHQATGEPRLEEAVLFWLERTLSLRKDAEGVAGFLTYKPRPFPDRPWSDEPGFLIGAAGIGLALLGMISTEEPAWDRVMLVDIPPNLEPHGN